MTRKYRYNDKEENSVFVEDSDEGVWVVTRGSPNWELLGIDVAEAAGVIEPVRLVEQYVEQDNKVQFYKAELSVAKMVMDEYALDLGPTADEIESIKLYLKSINPTVGGEALPRPTILGKYDLY